MSTKQVHLAVLVTISVLCHGLPWRKSHQESSDKLGMISPVYTNISKYSYTVAVLVDIDLLGGGALIQQNWVLTAASVLRNFNASDLSVRVASNSAYEGGRIHRVTQTIAHPLYATNSSYNLALLKLDSPIYPRVASKVTYVARIPFANNGIEGNSTGYGATSSSEVNDNQWLQIAQGQVYTSSYCQRNWGWTVSSLHICEYSHNTVPCYGDDVNPLTVLEWVTVQATGHRYWYRQVYKYEPSAFVDLSQL